MKSEITHQFKKDYRQVKYSGRYNVKEIDLILCRIIDEKPLEPKNCDHELSGNKRGIRECHIFPDLLLMYRYFDGGVIFIRLGSHAELFK